MDEDEKRAIHDICIRHGALQASFLEPGGIEVAEWPRHKCRYGCPSFNSSLCCPPHSPSPERTRRLLDEYRLGVMLRFASPAEVTEAVADIERALLLVNYPKAIAFGAGPCGLCETCSFTRCTAADRARPSMTGCGIDVFTTASRCGFSLAIAGSAEDRVSGYGLVMVQ